VGALFFDPGQTPFSFSSFSNIRAKGIRYCRPSPRIPHLRGKGFRDQSASGTSCSTPPGIGPAAMLQAVSRRPRNLHAKWVSKSSRPQAESPVQRTDIIVARGTLSGCGDWIRSGPTGKILNAKVYDKHDKFRSDLEETYLFTVMEHRVRFQVYPMASARSRMR